MHCTIMTPSIGSLNGASQSSMDLILACNQVNRFLSVIYLHSSKIPNNIDCHKLKDLKFYKSALELQSPYKNNHINLTTLRRWIDSKIFDSYRSKKISQLHSEILIVNSIAGHKIYEKYKNIKYKRKILVVRESPRHFEYKFNEPTALVDAQNKMKMYDNYIFVSLNVLEEWKKILSLENHQCFYIHNCINETKIKNLLVQDKNKIKKDLNFTNDEFHIVCVASIQFRKGQDILINMLPKLAQCIPNMKLHLVGPFFQPFTNELMQNKTYIKYKKYIKLWGSRTDAFKIIYASDVFLFPTRAEAFPRVILESMALQTPILSSDVDGIPEMIDNNISALLFSHNNYNKILDDLILIYNNKTLTEKLINNASINYWEKFSREKQLVRFNDFFNSIS